LNIVAEWQETAAGMASGTAPNPDGSVELISMWVAPFARGRGVGDALVNAVIEWAREQQASTVALGVLEGNERAVAFYRRHGFSRSVPTSGPSSNIGWCVISPRAFVKSQVELDSSGRSPRTNFQFVGPRFCHDRRLLGKENRREHGPNNDTIVTNQ